MDVSKKLENKEGNPAVSKSFSFITKAGVSDLVWMPWPSKLDTATGTCQIELYTLTVPTTAIRQSCHAYMKHKGAKVVAPQFLASQFQSTEKIWFKLLLLCRDIQIPSLKKKTDAAT